MSCGYVNVKCTLVIWDILLIKVVKDSNDLLVAFNMILLYLKTDVMRCNNILQVVKIFKERALLMHEYDLYVLLFNYFKEKDL
jgi:hypothetical protein